ncbi:hypothetical protein KAZ93_01890 [Patescibacteria group bacterium]|nr:hypothetical protein [Patescibacteria group bacterium]
MTDNQILATIYLCEITSRPYRIISQELAFYNKHHLPLPRRHPDQRHADRMALRAPRELRLRTCDKCGHEMISVYEKSNDNKVYCKSCYQKEIYS